MRRRFWTLLLLGIIGAGGAGALCALGTALRFGAPLRWYLGGGYLPLVAALAASVAAGALAGVRVARSWGRGGPRIPAPGLLRLGLYLAFALWIFQLGWLQPFRRMIFDFAAASTYGIFALACLAGPRWIRRVPRRAIRIADVVCMNLVVVAVGGELALRVLAAMRPSPIFVRAEVSSKERIEKNRYRAGEIRYGFPCNSLGEYDGEFARKAPGRTLVITIGDSFSAGVVPHERHFTTICERELPGVDVYNMGVPSIGPAEYLYLLRYEAMRLDPDLVVVDLFVGNDIRVQRMPPRRDRWLRSWMDRSRLYLWILPGRVARIAREGEGRDLSSPRPPVAGGGFPWVDDWRLEEPPMSRAMLIRNEIRGARHAWTGGDVTYARLFSVLEEIVAAARPARVGFMIIPSRFQLEEATFEAVAAAVPEVISDRDLPQRRLASWFRERDVPYLDLLGPLRAVAALEDGSRHCYHRNDTHFNARGNEVAGRELARFVRSLVGPKGGSSGSPGDSVPAHPALGDGSGSSPRSTLRR